MSQAEAIASVRAFSVHAEALREDLGSILQSPIFRGSPRSQDFLNYVVDKALEGDFDALKERSIGAGLFGRAPTYDTGEDAVVRVAASDVRKRLMQYYGTSDARCRFRIELPSGSYIPAFYLAESATAEPASVPGQRTVATITEAAPRLHPPRRLRIALWILVAVCAGAGIWFAARMAATPRAQKNTLPWSALFAEARRTQIILCDTNLSLMHALLGFQISLSDYANRRYLPEMDRSVSPDMQRVVRDLAGIDYTAPTATVDAVTSLKIAQLAGRYSSRLSVRPARSLQLRDFDSDDNFILMGSPNSNPWNSLFADQLDFSFAYDHALKREVLRNTRPRPGELPQYVPTALGGATGQAFSILAFIANPHHSGGHILLVAGTTAEATEAAANFVMDADACAGTLRKFGIEPGSQRSFEALLRVTEMAGAPARFEVLTIHALQDKPATH